MSTDGHVARHVAGHVEGHVEEDSEGVHSRGGSVERNDSSSTGPLVKPSPQLSVRQAVELQMSALAHNDTPRTDHGLEVLYYFANAEGTLADPAVISSSSSSAASLLSPLPCYFGFAADLYHFGHFALKFKTRYRRLLNHGGARILSLRPLNSTGSCVQCRVSVRVAPLQAQIKGGKPDVHGRAMGKEVEDEREGMQGNVGDGGGIEGNVVEGEQVEGSVGEGEEEWVMQLSHVPRGIQPPCWLVDSLLPSS
ncbi:unnamed protein product [Closterium sp. Yama58-4]|nr:unnamed protein product [Closterium sp. Yama58-4]